MASPTSWFGLRTKSSSKRSVSPIPHPTPFSNASLSLRASMRSRSQPAHDSGRRSANLHPTDSPAQEQLVENTSPAESRSSAESGCCPEGALESRREELMGTYLSWVNAHLKRRKDSEKITDLSSALRDGVTLLQLAEVLSGREVPAVSREPSCEEDRASNVSRVLSFLLGEGLELSSVSAREIMAGNLKHLLKVIYAMACHYRAAPNQRATAPTEDNSCASPAVSEYASLKRQVNEFEKKLRGNALIDKYRRMSINSNVLSDLETAGGGGGGGYDTDNTVCDSEGSEHSPVVSIPKGTHSDELEEPIYVNLPLCSSLPSQPTHDYASILRYGGANADSAKQNLISNGESGIVKNREVQVYCEDSTDQIVTPSPILREVTVETCLDDLSASLSDLTPIKQQIMEVQNVLGRSTLPCDLSSEVSALRSQLGDLRAKYEERSCQLSESEQKREELSSELRSVVQECTDLSNRLTESLSIRADVLRKDYLLQNSESENLSLRISVREKEEIINQLSGRLLLRQELVTTLESQVNELNRERERRGRISEPHPSVCTLSDPSDAKGQLSTRVKEVCEVLFALRSRVSKDTLSIHMIDSIENGLYAIVERLYYYAARTLKRPKPDSKERGPGRRSESPASSGNTSLSRDKEECTDLDPSQLVVFDICQSPQTHEAPPGARPYTQLLYYINKQETPCRVGIQKPASDVKLSDVKCQINRAGSFSYHFKVEDPDFGALKEEISGDTDRVPVYKKNTVVVYLESDVV